MNAFMIRNKDTGEYFVNGKTHGKGRKSLKWGSRGQIWSHMNGPRQIFKLYELKGTAEIVTFELREI